VLLFIDRLPLHSSPATHIPQNRRWTVFLPIRATDPEDKLRVNSAAKASFLPWILDTGMTGEAFAGFEHLRTLGLSAALHRRTIEGGTVRSPLGTRTGRDLRYATLWLFSNIPALWRNPLPMELGDGIDLPKSPATQFPYPVLGMRAMVRHGFVFKINLRHRNVSVWVPRVWYAKHISFGRRVRASGPFRAIDNTINISWKG
jgi:hypothetical protein